MCASANEQILALCLVKVRPKIFFITLVLTAEATLNFVNEQSIVIFRHI